MRTSKSDIPALLDLTRSADIKSRRRAIMALCPCELKSHSAEVWQRVIEMADDPDASVRRSVIHTVADGSPAQYEPKIVEALEKLYNDPERSVRRMARHVLSRYRHTGNLNTL